MYKRLQLIKNFRILYLGIIVTVLSSCSSDGVYRLFDGGEKPGSEIATLIFPNALDLKEVDGKNLSSRFFSNNDTYQLQVLPGKHFIKTAYSEYWGKEKNGSMERSDDFYFAVDATAGTTYSFKHNGPVDLKTALTTHSAKDIAIWLVNEADGSRIDPASSQSYGGFLTSLLQNESAKKPEMDTHSNPATVDPAIRKTVESQLQYWWNIADTEQRENFRKWLNAQ